MKNTIFLCFVLFLVISQAYCLFKREIEPENFDVVNEIARRKAIWAAKPALGDSDCATEWMWKLLNKNATNEAPNGKACSGQGECDNPETRDRVLIVMTKVNVIVHAMFSNETHEGPNGITYDDIQDLIAQMNEDYESTGIQFDVKETIIHFDDRYTYIPEYSNTYKWAIAIDEMKEEYAEDPKTTMNIFISGQKQGVFGTLLGIATFPWDPTALTALGGFWLNAQVVADVKKGVRTAQHELGHNFGLWHTFHGSAEVSCSSACYEAPHHAGDDYSANYVGDFCADTLATPKNYDCKNPAGTACATASADGVAQSWGVTSYRNIMGYSRRPNPCRVSFSPCQTKRMHCWTCNAIVSQVANPDQACIAA